MATGITAWAKRYRQELGNDDETVDYQHIKLFGLKEYWELRQKHRLEDSKESTMSTPEVEVHALVA